MSLKKKGKQKMAAKEKRELWEGDNAADLGVSSEDVATKTPNIITTTKTGEQVRETEEPVLSTLDPTTKLNTAFGGDDLPVDRKFQMFSYDDTDPNVNFENISPELLSNTCVPKNECMFPHSGKNPYARGDAKDLCYCLPFICKDHLHSMFGLVESYKSVSVYSGNRTRCDEGIEGPFLRASNPLARYKNCDKPVFAAGDVIFPIGNKNGARDMCARSNNVEFLKLFMNPYHIEVLKTFVHRTKKFLKAMDYVNFVNTMCDNMDLRVDKDSVVEQQIIVGLDALYRSSLSDDLKSIDSFVELKRSIPVTPYRIALIKNMLLYKHIVRHLRSVPILKVLFPNVVLANIIRCMDIESDSHKFPSKPNVVLTNQGLVALLPICEGERLMCRIWGPDKGAITTEDLIKASGAVNPSNFNSNVRVLSDGLYVQLKQYLNTLLVNPKLNTSIKARPRNNEMVSSLMFFDRQTDKITEPQSFPMTRINLASWD